MRARLARLAALALLALLALSPACSPRRSGGRAARADRNVITQQQMRAGNFQNAYDAVAALRSNWLRPRGPDSFNTPSVVWVYYDNTRMGDVEALRRVTTATIESIRFYDGVTATGRWGVGHSAGVIAISTWSDPLRQAPRDSAPRPAGRRPDPAASRAPAAPRAPATTHSTD